MIIDLTDIPDNQSMILIILQHPTVITTSEKPGTGDFATVNTSANGNETGMSSTEELKTTSNGATNGR